MKWDSKFKDIEVGWYFNDEPTCAEERGYDVNETTIESFMGDMPSRVFSTQPGSLASSKFKTWHTYQVASQTLFWGPRSLHLVSKENYIALVIVTEAIFNNKNEVRGDKLTNLDSALVNTLYDEDYKPLREKYNVLPVFDVGNDTRSLSGQL